MDLTVMELNALDILWQTSGGNLEFRKAIENELQLRIASNKNFSIEYLFSLSVIKNRALTIIFITTSEAYNNYGANITVSLIFEDRELERVVSNYSSKPSINSYGTVKAEVLVKDDLSLEQIENLKTAGFSTSDILELLSL